MPCHVEKGVLGTTKGGGGLGVGTTRRGKGGGVSGTAYFKRRRYY